MMNMSRFNEVLNMNVFDKVVKWVSLTITSVFIVCLSMLVFWITWPYNVLKIHNEPISISSKPICAGEYISGVVKYSKSIDVVADIQMVMINDMTIVLEGGKYNAPIGKNKQTRVGTTIPKHVPAGKYFIKVSATYAVNPIRSVTTSFVSERFDVVKCGEK